MKTDQYPKTMTDAVDVMAKHPFDASYYEQTKRARKKNKRTETEPGPTMPQLAQSKDYCCHLCSGKDHPKKGCPLTGTPRTEWFVTKAMNKVLLNQKDDKELSNKNKTNNKNTFCAKESNSNDDANRWCTFKTILPDNDEEDHNVLFDQTKGYKSKFDA